MHYKTDLLTDKQMAHFLTKVGDELDLDVPDGVGGFLKQHCQVTNIEITDAGTHPDSGEHLTRVMLRLE